MYTVRGAIPIASWPSSWVFSNASSLNKGKHNGDGVWIPDLNWRNFVVLYWELSSLFEYFLLTLYLVSIPLLSCGSFHVTTMASFTSLAVTSLGWLGTITNEMVQRLINLPFDIITSEGLKPQKGSVLNEWSGGFRITAHKCTLIEVASIFFKNSVATEYSQLSPWGHPLLPKPPYYGNLPITDIPLLRTTRYYGIW